MIIDFILENWRWLIVVCIAIAEFFVVLFRKKVKIVDSVYQFILDRLPVYVCSAEKLLGSGNGQEKFNCVLGMLQDALLNEFGLEIDGYIDFISEHIEKLLCTPQKKGVSN